MPHLAFDRRVALLPGARQSGRPWLVRLWTRLRPPHGIPLVWRAFLLNGAILLAACVLLLLTPATVSFPVAIGEAVVVLVGVVLMLLVTLPAYRRTFAPLQRLADRMSRVDVLAPEERVPEDGRDAEVNVLSRAFNEMLDRLEAERRASSARTAAAQEEERRRVAHALHDHVGQVLTGVLLQAERAARDAPPEMRPRVDEMRDAARSALEDVRRIARELRPEALDDLGLATALSALATAITRQSQLRIERSLDRELPQLSPERELLVYRVAQEALTNVVRHANAHTAWLTLRRLPGAVELIIEDDGRGLPLALPPLSGGLRGLRERALATDAALRVGDRSSRGTRVELRVPVDA